MIKKISLNICFLLFVFNQYGQLDSYSGSFEKIGVSKQKLNVLDSVMHSFVDNKEFSAIQTAIVKNGQIIHFDSYGFSEIESKKELNENDIFRIASMTKPIVSVALMMLHEQGYFNLDDPLSKFIPEFKELKKGKKQKPVKSN